VNKLFLKTIFLLILIILPILSFKGIAKNIPPKKVTESSPSFSYGKFKVGSRAYVFSDKVNLRETPSVSGKLVKQLKIGEAFTIKSRSDQTYEVSGYKDYWYEVVGQNFKGYLWGGLIAKVALKANLDADSEAELILVGLNGQGSASLNKLAEARVIDNDMVASKLSFNPIETADDHMFTYALSGEFLPDKGFVPFIKLLRLNFEYGACDYLNGDILLALKGKQLVYVLKAISSGNEEGSTSFKYIFPNDKAGKQNQLILMQTVAEVQDEADDKTKKVGSGQKILSSTKTVYEWNGKSFEPLKSKKN
jgi:hypothetical protein